MDDTFSVPGPSGIKAAILKAAAAKTTNASDPAKPQTTLDLVCEAIEIMGTGKKGASVQAIKKYIQGKKDSQTPMLNTLVNKALAKGIDKGILSRPTKYKDNTGATGCFVLVKVTKPKIPKKAATKKPDNKVNAIVEKPTKIAKERKRSVSDTIPVNDLPNITSTPKPEISGTSKVSAKTKKPPAKRRALKGRKDSSDTEIVVKKKGRKSLKSYSSDTEVDFVQKNEPQKAEASRKKIRAVKSKAEKPPPPSSDPSSNATTKAKGTKKLYNSSEEKPVKDASKKTGKTRPKKQT